MKLLGIKTLVTGASGFIGARLSEYLVSEGADVKVLIRDETQVATFNRMKCRSIVGDVTQPESLGPAVKDCEYIFHCAGHKGRPSAEAVRTVNVDGTVNLLSAADQAGVKRMVHVSSVAVHGNTLPASVTEELPLQITGNAYTVSKAEGEQAALNFGRTHAIEVVVVRPTLVYGPGSSDWVVQPLLQAQRNELVLINDGNGSANFIYIDDLLEGMILAAQVPAAAGEAFLLSGQQPVTWREYLGCLTTMCNKPLPPSMPLWQARIKMRSSSWLSRLTRRPMRINAAFWNLMTQRSVVSIEKARHILGFSPRMTLEEGMRHTEIWLKSCGYLPNSVGHDDVYSVAKPDELLIR